MLYESDGGESMSADRRIDERGLATDRPTPMEAAKSLIKYIKV